jgi:hypothetical protein
MKKIYQDQSASALKLGIVSEFLALDQFNVLSSLMIKTPIKIEARIIGASHCISFVLNKQLFTEVFACTEVRAKNIIFARQLSEMSCPLHLRLNEFDYKFKAKIISWEEGVSFSESLEQLARKKSEKIIGLVEDFPVCHKTGLIPKTIIVISNKSDLGFVQIDTVHSYPNEQKIVFTTSTIETEKKYEL